MTDSSDDQAPRRAYSRLHLGISAQLETLDGRQRVRMIDLSQGGAHLILSKPGDIRQAVQHGMTIDGGQSRGVRLDSRAYDHACSQPLSMAQMAKA